jgi:rhodanese-related sulfurtransferase
VSVERSSREELNAKLDRGEDAVLVEALGEARYEEAHLPDATNIPYDRMDELAPGLLPAKGVQIPVYCSNGPCRNSGIASDILARLGYEDVRDYHEGSRTGSKRACPQRATGRGSPAKAYPSRPRGTEEGGDEAWSSPVYNVRVRQEVRVV